MAFVPLLLLALSAAIPRPAAARELTLAVRTKARLHAVEQVFVTPFHAATDIPVLAQSWPGGMPALTTGLAGKGPAWDLVEVNGLELINGCAAGLFTKLDANQIGGAAHYLPMAVSPCGIGASVANTVLAWDRDKFPGTPSWADFWDEAKYPGKRGLRQGVRGNLEIALMADGVAPGDVYKVLATPDGVKRAFRKLDQLRPYIVWWHTPAEAMKILAGGGVLMTTAPSAAVVAAARRTHRAFGIRWQQSLFDVLSWAIAKTSPNQATALQFLYFAGTPAIQGQLAVRFAEGGLAAAANDDLPPDAAAVSPTTPDHLKVALRINDAFWHDHLAALQKQFNAWLSH
ncbi:MAG: extracellular solute-binding protein [Rhodospirillales bacterium]|jgi:putative spermidine/putrescine transport system substrate-binding protein|nr:extracellular solute-binding protein [Rhodospirillales bacterium]